MSELGAALIGQKPKSSTAAQKFGMGALPLPRRPDENLTSRYSPAVSPKDPSTKGPFSVQGQKASDLEYRTYSALRRLGWSDPNIQFQTPILGGRRPGGQVLDFVLYAQGAVYVIFVNGDYWHKYGGKGDTTRMNENIAKSVMKGSTVISLFNGDLLTDEQAYLKLRQLVGRGS